MLDGRDKGVQEWLLEARNFFSYSNRWAQGCSARDVRGKRVDLLGDDACRFCLTGYFDRSLGFEPSVKGLKMSIFEAIASAALALGAHRSTNRHEADFVVVDVNDHNDYSTVMRILDRAIASAGEGV